MRISFGRAVDWALKRARRSLLLTAVITAMAAGAGAQTPYLVKDLVSGNNGTGGPLYLTDMNGTLYFRLDNGTSSSARLWRSDGTAAGTVMVKDVQVSKRPVVIGSTLFFGSGNQLWKSDGTTAGTVMVKDLLSGDLFTRVDTLAALNGTLLFMFAPGGSVYQIWKSDGTTAGTVLVKDISPGLTTKFVAAGPYAFFSVFGSFAGQQLWRTDGTAAGTIQLKSFTSNILNLTASGSRVFFNGNDGGGAGNELWTSDGTSAGTVLLKDVEPGAFGSNPSSICDVNGIVYFFAAGGYTGHNGLWKSDGSAAGTVQVLEMASEGMTNVNGTVFFLGWPLTGGRELWKSNGTASSTVLVKDINPGSGDSNPENIVSYGGLAYFRADDGQSGSEPWRSNGTSGGTVRLGDIRPGSTGTFPSEMTGSGNRLFFVANDGTNGVELWAVDVPPTVSIDDRSVAEGAAVNAAFRVFLSGASTSTVTVQYATANNTGASGSDYTATSGTLTFSPGRTQHSIFVPIVSDGTAEGSETFFVDLSNPTNAVLGGKSQGIGTITDPPAAAKAAMYRSYNKSTDYHFFTTDLNSKNFAVNVLGFQDESNPIPFYVWNVMQSGTTPLFRMYNPNLGRHFYTASSGSRDFIMSIGGLYEKEEGFVYPLSTSPVPAGATELFLLYNNNSGTHLFTADANQKNAILGLFPGVWVQHTSVGYVFTSP